MKIATTANHSARQEEFGHFPTASSVADFMASISGPLPRAVRLVDAGAGSLTAAFVSRCSEKPDGVRAIEATLHELPHCGAAPPARGTVSRRGSGSAEGLALGGLLPGVGRKLGIGEVTPMDFMLAPGALSAIKIGTLYQKKNVQPCDVRTANTVQLAANLPRPAADRPQPFSKETP